MLVGKGEDAEILQARDGPAGPGGAEVGLETGLDKKSEALGWGLYQAQLPCLPQVQSSEPSS